MAELNQQNLDCFQESIDRCISDTLHLVQKYSSDYDRNYIDVIIDAITYGYSNTIAYCYKKYNRFYHIRISGISVLMELWQRQRFDEILSELDREEEEDYKRNCKIKIRNWKLNDLIEENDCDEEDDYTNE